MSLKKSDKYSDRGKLKMEFTKAQLQEKSQTELIEIILKLQSDLKVVEAWGDYSAKEKIRLFEKLHGLELPKD